MVDLHTHSNFSDGSDTPEELVEKAYKLGLKAVALTDHNTIDGLDQFLKAGEKYKGEMEVIPGIEFSTEADGKDFHILALYIDKNHYTDIENYLSVMIKNKIESNKDLVQSLKNAGYEIDYNEIVKANKTENFNRVAIANALKEKGYADSVADAFEKYLHRKNGYYNPLEKLNTFDVIKFINSIGAISIWAHPLKAITAEEFKKYLPQAKEAGLIAVETMHSLYNEEQQKQVEALAKKYKLLPSGGSDYHGSNKDNVLLGTGTNNNVAISDKMLEILKEKHFKGETNGKEKADS